MILAWHSTMVTLVKQNPNRQKQAPIFWDLLYGWETLSSSNRLPIVQREYFWGINSYPKFAPILSFPPFWVVNHHQPPSNIIKHHYPLVICYIIMDNHHFQWKHTLFRLGHGFHSYVSHYQVGYPSFTTPKDVLQFRSSRNLDSWPKKHHQGKVYPLVVTNSLRPHSNHHAING